MRKYAASLCVVLALTLVVALVPTLTSAAEFSYAGPPAFTVTHPGGAPDELSSPEIVWAVKTGGGLVVQASVHPFPKGLN